MDGRFCTTLGTHIETILPGRMEGVKPRCETEMVVVVDYRRSRIYVSNRSDVKANGNDLRGNGRDRTAP